MKVWINDFFVSKEAMEEIDKHYKPDQKRDESKLLIQYEEKDKVKPE